jgi:hypothetical protein
MIVLNDWLLPPLHYSIALRAAGSSIYNNVHVAMYMYY